MPPSRRLMPGAAKMIERADIGLTRVNLVFLAERIERWIRFGQIAAEGSTTAGAAP